MSEARSASALALPLLTLLGAIVLLRAGVMLASGAGLHVDEAQYWDWSRHLAWGYWSKPPAIAALIATSTALAGDSVLGVRLACMVFWGLAAAVLGWLAWDMAGRGDAGRRAGLWAAVLLAGTPAAGILGMAATTDAPLMLAWACCMALSWCALRTPAGASPLPWWLLAGAVLGLGLLSKYTMAALGASWALIFLRQWRRHGLGMVLAGLVALAVFSPNLLWNAAHGWPTLGHTAEITVAAATPASGKIASVAEFIAGQMVLLGPVGLWTGVLVWRRRSRPAATLPRVAAPLQPLAFAWIFALPLLLVALAQSIHARAFMNWTAPALLGLCLALGLPASRCLGRRAWVVAALMGVLVPAAVSLASLSAQVREDGQQGSPHLDLWARMRGWDVTLGALAPTLQQHPDVPVVTTARDLLVQARYAWRGEPRQVMAWPRPGRPRNHYEQFQSLWQPGQAAPPVVLVLSEGAPGTELRQTYAHWQRLDQARWGRLDLQLWRASHTP
jgi:4-amino-4-deoxy-L-arabinose transferase-like glycosyltransferase